MSKLLARIMLAIFMLPAGGIVMTIVFIVTIESDLAAYPYHRRSAWIVAALATWVFVAIYWLLLWHKSVRWNAWRVRATLWSGAVAALAGASVGFTVRWIDYDFGFFVFATVTILVWLPLTVFVWRESAEERASGLGDAEFALSCPTCGYNLTGLNTARCPECGSTFTLDELVRRQPARDQAELQV